MKIIVGLGNPGEKYQHTRHNVGFLAMDFLLRYGTGFMQARPGKDFKSEIFTLDTEGGKIVIMKPQTYMNDSGQALKDICNFYKIDLAQDLLVVHDEVDLPFGEIRLAKNSSAAGHNGVQSIISDLGTQDFRRIRVGVEARASRNEMPTENFVLQSFTADELVKLQSDILPEVKQEIERFINV